MILSLPANSIFDNVLFIIVAVAASCLATFLLMRHFSKRERTAQKDNLASHFELKELTSRRKLFWLSFLWSLPFSLLFLVICLKAPTLLSAGRKLLESSVVDILSPSSTEKVRLALDAIPTWIDPVFVLAVSLLLFGTYVRWPFDFCRNLIFTVFDVDERVNEIAENAAEAFLNTRDYDDAEQALLELTNSNHAPVPKELAESPDKVILGYQLIYFSKKAIATSGLREGLQETLKRVGIEMPLIKNHRPLISRQIYSALIFYLVLCAVYAILAPLMEPIVSSAFVREMLQQIEWPKHTDELALSIVQRTLSFVIPLAVGMSLVTKRHELPFVVSVQFAVSLIVNLVFAAVLVAQSATGETPAYSFVLGNLTLGYWVDAFAYSLTPSFALLSWIFCGRVEAGKTVTVLIVCVAAAIAFCLSQLMYEAIAIGRTGYYWHQLLLGAFITMSYGLAALVASDVLPPLDASRLSRRSDEEANAAASAA
jgi:hypothetical protein